MPEPENEPSQLVRSLMAEGESVVRSLLSPAEPVALLDFPFHLNSGDSAIWLGAVLLLRRLGHELRYVADADRYAASSLKRAHPEGPILLLGGGNVGDLWPVHQKLREQVLRDFPDRRVIQLPQSIAFRDPAARQRVETAFRAHEGFHLLVRDRQSLAAAKELVDSPLLCPDLALQIGPLTRRAAPYRDVLFLARTDHESGGFRAAVERAQSELGSLRTSVQDWHRPEAARRWELAKTPARISRRLPAGSWPRRLSDAACGPAFDYMARELVRTATRQLSTARVVVTDRLHAHVLALLLGIPHVVCDNSYGKIRSMYETYTGASTATTWADDGAQAARLAQNLVTEHA